MSHLPAVAPRYRMRPSRRIATALALGLAAALGTFGMAAADEATEAANLALAIETFEKIFVGDESALDAFGDPYIQHNPGLPDGVEVLAGLTAAYAGAEAGLYEPIRAAAQDDLVFIHSWLHIDETFAPDPAGPGLAVVDIFRFEDGKIVEHWDVIQPAVPAEETVSGNDMFSQVGGG